MTPQPLQPSLIEVVNGRRPGSIPGGRESAIGNPFDMRRDERLRDPVCDAFDAYFDAVVRDGEEPVKEAARLAKARGLTLAYAWKRPSRDEFMEALAVIEERQKQGLKTQIQCFCHPSRCHLDTVKGYLDAKRETALKQQDSEAPQPHKAGYAPASPDYITALEPHQVFVFGSNTQGRHGKGAAAQAMAFGAQVGNPRGRQGQSYAIMTKDLTKPKGQQQRSVSLNAIEAQINAFLQHAIAHPGTECLVTRFGCDLAGYTEREIGSLWVGKAVPDNVRLPQAFLDVLQAEQPVVALEVGVIQAATDICLGRRRGQQPLPTHILSIGSHTEAPPQGLEQFPGRVLRLEFDELDEPKLGLKTATREQLEAALSFGREARQAGGRLFVHCSAGVRRSPTIALAILVDQLDDPAQAVVMLRKLSPNALLIESTIQLIDTVLGTKLHKTALTVEERTTNPFSMTPKRTDIIIYSGGQTGADYGGLLGAEALGLQTGGIAPHGWLTEKGVDLTLARFGLVEGPPGKSNEQTYRLRTELNVQQTDGTVVFGSVDPTHDRGSALTLELADQHGKPWIQFEVAELYNPVTAAAELRDWLMEHNIRVLNVAGNRGSKNPALESLVQTVIETACREPFQSLETTLQPVPCGLLLDPAADWEAETDAVQSMLEQITAHLAPQEQLLIYCDRPPQREWLEAIAQTLSQPQTVAITSEPTQWVGQKSWLVCLFQGTAETKRALETAAGMGLACLGFDTQKRTYFRVVPTPVQSVSKQSDLER